MITDAMKDAVARIEANAQNRPSSCEFEMAYQVRVAMDRIRFAIRITEMTSGKSEERMEAILQLADALDRLDAAERRFQDRWRRPAYPRTLPLVSDSDVHKNGSNGHNM